MDQQRLFKVAPDAITLTMAWEHPHGWSLNVGVHRSGVHDVSWVLDRYEQLSAEELVSLVSTVMQVLG